MSIVKTSGFDQGTGLKTAMLLAIIVASFSVAYAAPSAGTCMCSTTNGLNARDAAGTSSHVVTSISLNECFKFNGGVLTKDGHTWYELQNVHGHPRVWVASEYLKVSSSSHCGSSSGGSVSTGTHKFAEGPVSQQCLQCICYHESRCHPIGCHFDVNSDSCGYFQIKENYWIDCGRPGTSWKQCADDIHCSSLCVQNYMKRYAAHYNCPMTCEGFAREHNGGPRGCHSGGTLGYWRDLTNHPGCHNVH